MNLEDLSKRKEVFDFFLIGSVIVRLIKLLEFGKFRFENVFFFKERFYCFIGELKIRRKVIEKINLIIMNI